MSEDFGPTFITVTDEDGKELVLEFVDALEYNGQMYQAFFPAETEGENEDDPDNGLVILKVIHEDGEDLLSTSSSWSCCLTRTRNNSSVSTQTLKGICHSACPAGCVIDLFLTHISLLGMHLSGCGSQASRLPFAVGSWKR